MRSATEAVELLETLPPGRELALAYARLSAMYMVDSDSAGTMLWGKRALELAEQLQDAETVCSVLNGMGTAELEEGQVGGRGQAGA